MVCMLALFRIEKTEGSENVKWTTGVMTCVTFGLEIGKADTDLLGIHYRSRAGSSRETKRWILKSWRP